MKLRGLIEDAFEKAGIELPKQPEKKAVKVRYQKAGTSSNKKASKRKEPAKKQLKVPSVGPVAFPRKEKPKIVLADPPKEDGGDVKREYLANGVLVTRSKEKPRKQTRGQIASTLLQKPNLACMSAESEQEKVSYTLKAGPCPRVVWPSASEGENCRLLKFACDGRSSQLSDSGHEKALRLGLDFGSSTVKAVIYDNVAESCYAVPFRQTQGVQSYLLPCCVWLGESGYSLTSGATQFQDLKLAVLAKQASVEKQLPVVGFLALAVRQVRAWFLTAHAKDYPGPILWDLAIGLPVANNADRNTCALFRKLVTAAWIAASEEKITPERVMRALSRAKALIDGKDEPDPQEDVEVLPLPEVAAQIYGFMSSNAYDPHGKNIYLMVDVGAGTLDASVFRIEQPRDTQKSTLVVFNTTVQPNGVMNLHKKRMDQMLKICRDELPRHKSLHKEIESIAKVSDSKDSIPENINDYFTDLTITFNNGDVDADLYREVKKQVIANTYAKVKQENLLSDDDMKQMPMFICGGGSRFWLYQKIRQDIAQSPGFSWFGAVQRPLVKPTNLIAPGLKEQDYDRLSVAYGLSRLKMADLIHEVPALMTSINPVDYAARYIEK
jgi:hypothetical protein|tara:strand:- start:2653 stop:4479 length:1827 start_codon:yes stop_codon:yes gene_type:complete